MNSFFTDDDDLDEASERCPKCNEWIYVESEQCPKCHYYLSDEDWNPPKSSFWFVAMVILCLAIVISWLAMF